MPAPLIEASRLRKHFGNPARPAVRDLSFSLAPGEILALLGPNGAGKTTTIKMALGLITPSAGEVRALGYDMARPAEGRRAARRLGAVLEGTRNIYWRLSARENLRYFGRLRGLPGPRLEARATELLQQLDLSECQDQEARHFSRGMQQKLALAVALLHDPEALILDEPTLGLDLAAARQLETTISDFARQGKGIILTTHQLDLAERLAGRLLVIHEGREVAAGPTAALLREFDPRPLTEIKVDALPAGLAETLCRRWPALVIAAQHDQTRLVWPEAAQSQVVELYTWLDQAGCTVLGVSRRQPTLEEVFLALTQKEN